MGLMNRVLDSTSGGKHAPRKLHSDQIVPVGTSDGSKVLQRVLAAIEQLNTGLSAPAAVLELLQRRLGIKRGVLLIRDGSDNTFKPWAHVGLDPTTRYRLTLSYDQVRTLVPGFVTTLHAHKREPLMPHLSFREASRMEYAYLARLHYRSRLAGLLILLDTEIAAMEAANREMLLTAISEPIGRVLVRSREWTLDRMYEPLRLDPVDFRRSARYLAEDLEPSECSLVLIRADSASIARTILERSRLYDSQRAKLDVRAVIASLLGGAGDVCITERGEVHCAARMPYGETGELIVEALNRRVNGMFPELRQDDRIPCTLFCYPTTHSSIDKIFRELFDTP